MKSSFSRIILISFLLVLFIPNITLAEMKTFVREYTYEAGEIDSKVSCRILALEQVKRLLLEELGTALMSQTVVTNGQLTKDEIMTYAGGIVKTKIIEESWDGKSYRLKASIEANPEDVAKYINGVLGDQKKAKELASESKQVRDLVKEIENLKTEIRVKPDSEKLKRYEEAVENLTTLELLKNTFETVGHVEEDKDGNIKDTPRVREAIVSLDKILSRVPDFSSILEIRGVLYLYGLKEYGKAIKDFDAALKHNKWNIKGITTKEIEPEEILKLHADILKLKAYAQLKLGQHLDCLSTIEQAINIKPIGFALYDPFKLDDFDGLVKKCPNDFRAWLFRGIYIRSDLSIQNKKNEDLAIRDYQKSLKLNNRYPFTYYLLSDAYWTYFAYAYPKPVNHSNYQRKALEYSNKALKLKLSPVMGKLISCQVAGIQSDRKNYEAALAAYDKALEYSKDDGEIYIYKAVVYAKMQKPVDEIAEYGKALNASVRQSSLLSFGKDFTLNVYMLRGDAYKNAGKFKNAIDDYTNYIERKKAARQAVGIDSFKFTDSGYLRRGQAHIEFGNFKEAVDDLTNALNGYFPSPSTYEARAQAYSGLGNYQAALDDYNRAIDISKDKEFGGVTAIIAKRGRIFMQLKQYKNAIDDFDAVLGYYPEDINVLSGRGYSYYLLEIYDQALKDFNKVLTIAPDFAEILVARGEVLLIKNNLPDAVRDFTQAIELNPKYDNAYRGRGSAYLLMGQKEMGLQDYRIAARLENKDAQKYLRENNLSW